MKKFITTAVLFAASTALASAGTPSISGVTYETATADTSGTSVIATVVMNGATYAAAMSGTSYTNRYVLFYLSGSYVGSKDTATSGDVGIGFYNDGTSNHSGFWIALNYQNYNASEPTFTQDTHSGSNTSVQFDRSNGKCYLVNGTTEVEKIAVSYGFSSGTQSNYAYYGIAVSVLLADGTWQTLSSSVTSEWLGTTDSGGWVFSWDTYSYASDYVSEVFFNADAGEITTTALSEASLTALNIPEPSAFGLLAGVGALALVAARRRRRRSRAK